MMLPEESILNRQDFVFLWANRLELLKQKPFFSSFFLSFSFFVPHLYIGRQADNPLTYCNIVQQRRQYNNIIWEFNVLHTVAASLGVTVSNVLSLLISDFQTY